MRTSKFYLILISFLIFASSKVSSQAQNITINTQNNQDNSITINFEKKKPGSYSLAVLFSNVTNCNVTDFRMVINGYSGQLVKLKPINSSNGISYSMNYYYTLGKVNPRVDSLFQYLLPFKNGKKVRIMEASYIGEKYFGSEKPLNWKSYLVKSQSPDTIYSMRKGIVVDVNKDYDNNSSENAEYTSKRNLVTIEHEDGTFAQYKGFKKSSFFVTLGQEIYPQEALGIVEKYDKNDYRFDFSIFYLFDKDFELNGKQTLKDYKSKYKYLKPYFATEEGVLQIDSDKEYTVLANEEEIMKEFSRSEKKKYLKKSKIIK